jgi:hypothetical protein
MYRSLIAEAGLGTCFDAHAVHPAYADRARYLLDPFYERHDSPFTSLATAALTPISAAISPRLTTSILRFSLNLD